MILHHISPDSTLYVRSENAYFFALKANSGRFRISATQYPLMRKRKVRKA
jgi:hypothetical protein